MAEKIEGPVTVSQDGAERDTVITASGIVVGRTVTTRRPARPGFPGFDLPGSVLTDVGIEEDVVVAGDNVPATPDVNIDVGDRGSSGGITVRDEDDAAVISLNGRTGLLTLGTGKGAAGQLMLRSNSNGPVILVSGKDGRITFLDRQLKQTLVIDGLRGDIELIGADCAEDFDMGEQAEPGSVLTVDDHGLLAPCRQAYDRRVLGVASGAGGYRPGLRLDRRGRDDNRQPVALIGKAYCFVDADDAPVTVGDLLTTSNIEGHAMRAGDAQRAFGAVLGKSLASLDRGRGLLPVLVALQ